MALHYNLSIILLNGIKIDDANQSKKAGLVNIPGFYTIELTEQDSNTVSDKLTLANIFGTHRGLPSAVLIIKLCEDVYNKLEAKGQVLKRPIYGAENFTETIFKPESFNTLNKKAKFTQIIPGSTR